MSIGDLGFVLLALFLIVYGLTTLIPRLSFKDQHIIMGLLAGVAGILILIATIG